MCVQVHKAGSSTVYNMLARYALGHDLNVALPRAEFHVECYHTFGHITEDQVLPLAAGQPYHMLFSHMIYNSSVVQHLMPTDTFYVAIVRDPFRRFLSSIYSFSILRSPAVNNTDNKAFKAFLGNRQAVAKLERDCRLHNSFLCDTGLPWSLHNNETAVRHHLKKLDQELDLVLLMEYFAESLVLFKRRACLQLKDVLYFKANSRKNPNQHQILEEDVREIKKLEKGDYLAYEHFYSKFWEEVRKEGEDFHHEVSYLKDVIDRVGKYCSNASGWDTLVVAKSEWNEEFTLNDRDCKLLAMDERAMHQMLVKRAKARRARAGYQERGKTPVRWKPAC